jgi:hypothetical protein
MMKIKLIAIFFLIISSGEGFEIPEEFSNFRESRLFKLPLRLWSIKDEIYVLNPYRYEIHIYKDLKRSYPKILLI